MKPKHLPRDHHPLDDDNDLALVVDFPASTITPVALFKGYLHSWRSVAMGGLELVVRTEDADALVSIVGQQGVNLRWDVGREEQEMDEALAAVLGLSDE